jgi:diguanylate cyclase (GGDEF)-like protein
MRIHKLLENKNTSDVTTVKPDCSLVETATLLSEGKIGAVPVVDSKQVMVGIISERDLVRSLAEFQTGLFSKKVEDVMTSSVITCCGDDDVEDIYAQMTERRIRHMPVMQDGALVGMLSLRDFEAAYKYLQQNSVTDDLTGMVNARAFAEHLKVEFNRYRRFQFPLSVVVLKIGGYSQTLQRQGQAVCETLLKGLAESFKEQIRQFDIVGHISDDTFSVILPNTGSAAAHRACARLLKGARGFLASDVRAADLEIGLGLAFAEVDTRDHTSISEHANASAVRALEHGNEDYKVAAQKKPVAA